MGRFPVGDGQRARIDLALGFARQEGRQPALGQIELAPLFDEDVRKIFDNALEMREPFLDLLTFVHAAADITG